MLWNRQSGMRDHFGGTLTLKSDDGRGAGVLVDGTCPRGQDGGGGYMWARITCGQELRNCPLLMLLLVGNV